MKITSNFFPVLYRVFFILNALVFLPFLLDPVLYPRLIFLNVFLLVAIFAMYASHQPFRITITGMLLLALSLMYLLSCFVALYRGEAIYFFSKNISLTLLFLITASALEQNLLSKRDIIISMLLFGFLVALIALGQVIYFSFQPGSFFEAGGGPAPSTRNSGEKDGGASATDRGLV